MRARVRATVGAGARAGGRGVKVGVLVAVLRQYWLRLSGGGGALLEEVLGGVHDLLGAEPLGEEDEDDRLLRVGGVRLRVGGRVGVGEGERLGLGVRLGLRLGLGLG